MKFSPGALPRAAAERSGAQEASFLLVGFVSSGSYSYPSRRVAGTI